LGVSPEINALSSILIGLVASGVIIASLVSKRNSVRLRLEERTAERL